ncbi:MAG: hypothetical protein CBC48_06415 [bacterium TMED88]|nr:hypothetical protein [Deltaproteobacteria bacterium]OUV34168.1 MAG: hypothetical protein CBC48_06415 [bacterium TMED88]
MLAPIRSPWFVLAPIGALFGLLTTGYRPSPPCTGLTRLHLMNSASDAWNSSVSLPVPALLALS